MDNDPPIENEASSSSKGKARPSAGSKSLDWPTVMKKVQAALSKLASLRGVALKAAGESDDPRVGSLPAEVSEMMKKYDKVLKGR
eukprot:1887256-Alexandrium_andersonii.AAC.1